MMTKCRIRETRACSGTTTCPSSASPRGSFAAFALAAFLGAWIALPGAATATTALRIEAEGTLDFFAFPSSDFSTGLSRETLGLDDGSRFAMRLEIDPVDRSPVDTVGRFDITDFQISFEGAVFSSSPPPPPPGHVHLNPDGSGDLEIQALIGRAEGSLNGTDLAFTPFTALPLLLSFELAGLADGTRLPRGFGFSDVTDLQSGVFVVFEFRDDAQHLQPGTFRLRIEDIRGTAVPEPGSALLMGLGLAGLAASRRVA